MAASSSFTAKTFCLSNCQQIIRSRLWTSAAAAAAATSIALQLSATLNGVCMGSEICCWLRKSTICRRHSNGRTFGDVEMAMEAPSIQELDRDSSSYSRLWRSRRRSSQEWTEYKRQLSKDTFYLFCIIVVGATSFVIL
jgi:hypothetical protein